MTKILFLCLVLLPLSASAQDVDPTLTTEVTDSRLINHRASHWLVTFGFEGMDYQVPFEFEGERKSFKPKEQELYGGRLGFGRQFHLGKGIVTTTKVEGYYVGTLFEKAVNAAPEVETQTFSYSKKVGQVFGGEVIQSLGFMFDMKTKNPFLNTMTHLVVEPFIEAGFGQARAYNRTNYHYDTGPGGVQEDYHHKVVDDLTTARIGVGINLTADTGHYFYLRASQQSFSLKERKEEGWVKPNGGSVTPFDRKSDADLDSVMVYSFGGGYKF